VLRAYGLQRLRIEPQQAQDRRAIWVVCTPALTTRSCRTPGPVTSSGRRGPGIRAPVLEIFPVPPV